MDEFPHRLFFEGGTNFMEEWSYQILTNEFEDDNYWDTALQDSMPEAYEMISSIGKKYGDISEYERALELYNMYEPQIIDYYGGEQAVDFIIEEFGIIPVGIIKPPKLKGKLKAQYVKGISYQYGVYYDPMTPERQMELDKSRFDEEGNPEADELVPLTRSLKRALRTITVRENRKASQVYFNTDIISQIRDGSYYDSEDVCSDKWRNMSIEEHIRCNDEAAAPTYNYLSQEEMRAFVTGEKSKYQYTLTSGEPITVDIMIKKAMIDAGLNPISDEERKNMNPAQMRRLATYLGAENVYDDKTMKKLIKKTEKSKKRAEKEREKYNRNYNDHRASVDRALTDMLTSRSRISRLIKDMEDDDDE